MRDEALQPPAPGPVTRLAASSETSTAITLTWHAPTVGKKPVYHVRYRVNGASTWINWPATTQATTLQITGLRPNTAYDFEVEAVGN